MSGCLVSEGVNRLGGGLESLRGGWIEWTVDAIPNEQAYWVSSQGKVP